MSTSIQGKCCSTPSTGCLFRLPGQCVYYSGPSIDTTNINPGDNLNILVEKIIEAIPAISTYKRYVALLSQSGTNAPTAAVLENTLGGTVLWTRIGIANYEGILSGAFTANKTWVDAGNSNEDISNAAKGYAYRIDDNIIFLFTREPVAGAGVEDWNDIPIEIRVYP